MNTLYFNHSKQELEDMSSVAVQEQLKQDLKQDSNDGPVLKRRGRPFKSEREIKQMTPVTESLKVQKTVFDLKKFDDVKLVKEVQAPNRPSSLKEVSDMFGGETEKLLDIIYAGLVEDARERAQSDMDGFKVYDEEKDEKDFEPYSGSYADEEKGKLINAAVLSLAKMQGYDKNKTADEKRALKEKAREFLRANPAMLSSIQK